MSRRLTVENAASVLAAGMFAAAAILPGAGIAQAQENEPGANYWQTCQTAGNFGTLHVDVYEPRIYNARISVLSPNGRRDFNPRERIEPMKFDLSGIPVTPQTEAHPPQVTIHRDLPEQSTREQEEQSRVMGFIAGPCTEQPASVVTTGTQPNSAPEGNRPPSQPDISTYIDCTRPDGFAVVDLRFTRPQPPEGLTLSSSTNNRSHEIFYPQGTFPGVTQIAIDRVEVDPANPEGHLNIAIQRGRIPSGGLSEAEHRQTAMFSATYGPDSCPRPDQTP